MRDEGHVRVPRFTLTGLEDREELWDRLRESNAEIESLVARTTKLTAELDALRRRLGGASALTDEELAAELPRRMTRNLAAAQEVADDLLEQARNDAMLIRLNADQVASQVLGGAKAKGAQIVRSTMAEAEAKVAAARAQGNEILRAAHAERSRVWAELEDRSARMDAERQRLDDYRQRLEQAYDLVATNLADARAALGTGSGRVAPGRATSVAATEVAGREAGRTSPPTVAARRAPAAAAGMSTPAPARAPIGKATTTPAVAPTGPPTATPAGGPTGAPAPGPTGGSTGKSTLAPVPVAGGNGRPPAGGGGVFDWSGDPAPPDNPDRAPTTRGVLRSTRFPADAAAV